MGPSQTPRRLYTSLIIPTNSFAFEGQEIGWGNLRGTPRSPESPLGSGQGSLRSGFAAQLPWQH